MSEIEEVKSIYSELVRAFVQTQANLASAGQVSLPDATKLEFIALLTKVTNAVEQGIDFSNGVSQEVIFDAVSSIRDLNMCSLSKAGIYANIETGLEQESEVYAQTRDYSVGVLKGSATNGSQC
jgi:hypothetical protein